MSKAPVLRLAAALVLASLVPACERHDCATCDHAPHVTTAAPATAPAASTGPQAAVAKLAPWQTFDAAFNGCAGGCGMRMAGPTDDVVAQPGAMLGQKTYCLVSGV